MEEKLNELLDAEIRDQLGYLAMYNPKEPEYAVIADNVIKLYKLKIERDKEEMELYVKDQEVEFKKKQMTENVKDRYCRIGIAAAEICLPLAFYGIWMNRGFKFEETGTITSSTFRGLISRFRPTRK